jgi:C4-type Zn-finger protein
MFRALLAALFVGSLSLGFVGCGEEPAPAPEKKQSKIEGIMKKAGEAVNKATEEVKKDVETVKKDVEKAVEKEETK